MTRTIALAVGMVVVFAATVGILLAVMPGPHKATDYLVIGCVATLLCLLLLFLVLIYNAKRAQKADPPAQTDPPISPTS